MSRNFNGTNTDNLNLGDIATARFDKDAAWTYLCFARVEDLSGDERCLISKWETHAVDRQIEIFFTKDATPIAKVAMVSLDKITGSVEIPVDTWLLVAVSNAGTAGANSMKLYIIKMDLTMIENATAGTPDDAGDQTHAIEIGCKGTAGGDYFDGDMAHSCYVDGELSLQEIKSYLRTPGRMAGLWKGQYGVQWYLPILGSSPEPDWGGADISVTVNGTTASDMPPAAPSYAVDPNLTFQIVRTVAPGVAAVAVTGYAPTVTVLAAVIVSPGVAAITVTGNAPTVSVTPLSAPWEFRWGTQSQRLEYEALIRQLNVALRQLTHDQDAMCHRDKDMTIRGQWSLTGLPTSDPAEAGKLWNDSGTVKVSSG
jgi:hypothetical protein